MGFGGFGGGWEAASVDRAAANPGGGLPFAGIPSELQDGVDRLLADEPEHPDPGITFKFKADDSENVEADPPEPDLQVLAARRRRTRARHHPQHRQPGWPEAHRRRDQRRHGAGSKNFGLIVLVAIIYLAAIAVSSITQRWWRPGW